MTDYVAIHADNALAFLHRQGVPADTVREVLRTLKPASKFSGISYYYPDDLEAAADCYLDQMEA